MKAGNEEYPDAALDDEAAAWICERDEGFAPGRAEAFAVWRGRDPRHVAAVARVERALALLDEMPAVRTELEARASHVETIPEPASVQRRGRSVFPVWLGAMAAALVVGLGVWRAVGPSAPDFERHGTDAMSQERVVLRDGSVVDLNAGSELRVDFGAAERRVTLSSGEAHFQVAPDPARPFVVTAGSVAVRAVGTAFNVRLAADAVDVLVVEGKVEVANAIARPAEPSPIAPPLLGAGDRVRVSRENPAAPQVEKVDPAAMRTILAWQDRMTSFTDVPLREIVMRFNRRNATQLVVGDAELGERKIGGVIALDQVEAFVRLLEQDGDIVAERRGPAEIVLRRAR